MLTNLEQEAERAKEEEEARERHIAYGNPLLNKQDFTMKRRWDDDVVFKNQARGTEDKGKKKEFVNVSVPPASLAKHMPLVCHAHTSLLNVLVWNAANNPRIGSPAVRLSSSLHEQVRAVDELLRWKDIWFGAWVAS